MGEKPLGIDEALPQVGTMAGGAPPGGVDVPPPAMTGAAGGSAAAAALPPKPFEPTPTRPGDPFPDRPGPGGLAVKENGIKVDGGAEGSGPPAEPVAMEGDPLAAAVPGTDVDDTPGGDPDAGAALRPNPKYGWYRDRASKSARKVAAPRVHGDDAAHPPPEKAEPEVAASNNPIPGVDIIVKKSYGGPTPAPPPPPDPGPSRPAPPIPGIP